MVAYKLLCLSAACFLLCCLPCGKGFSLDSIGGTRSELSSPTFWQRIKTAAEHGQWQQISRDVESSTTIQRRRQLWQRLTVATVL
ncbi:hypothetical protein KR222_009265 [Zaprionus bogoriensis]|nr:hypothetical protein KR222_009265 [Zaprionus bogoriensis]